MENQDKSKEKYDNMGEMREGFYMFLYSIALRTHGLFHL